MDETQGQKGNPLPSFGNATATIRAAFLDQSTHRKQLSPYQDDDNEGTLKDNFCNYALELLDKWFMKPDEVHCGMVHMGYDCLGKPLNEN